MPDLSEELLSKLKSGEDHAFVELFWSHRPRLKQMLEFRMDRRLRGREDPSDILQQVYIDACQRIGHYLKRPDRSFYIWLRQLTMQRMIDVHRRHLKAEKRNVTTEVSIHNRLAAASSASMAALLVSQLASPSQMAMHAETAQQVQQALDAMEAIDREVLALRHFEELRNSEVAEVLGLKEAAASNRYMRALSRLRDVLEGLPGFHEQHRPGEPSDG